MNIVKKYLPLIITLVVILLSILISLIHGVNIKEFAFDSKKVDIDKVNEVLSLLDNDETKGKAESELNTLYEGVSKDDTYYLSLAKITMATDNIINATSPLNNVKIKTKEYYSLRLKSESGAFFTYGEVPSGLLSVAKEAYETYTDEFAFALLLGELYYDKDLYLSSIYYLDKALELEPDNTDALYYYALAIYQYGDEENGISYMQKALDSYKGDDKEYIQSMSNYIKIMKEGSK